MLRVVKVGGSLLSLGDLADRLRRWLDRQSPARNLLLVGGGPLVDVLRSWDARSSLEEEAAHWLAISLLDVTAGVLAAWMPELPMVESLQTGSDWTDQTLIFAPSRFLKCDEPAFPGTPLPANWQVTSDSIAARIACCAEAEELVLLKSRDLPAGLTLRELAECAYVDAHFPHAAAQLHRIRFENLRP